MVAFIENADGDIFPCWLSDEESCGRHIEKAIVVPYL